MPRLKTEHRSEIRELQEYSGGKGPLKISHPTPAQSSRLLQVDLENLQGWRVRSCPGQPIPLLDCPQGEKISPCIWSKPLLFQFMIIVSHLSTIHLHKDLGSTFLLAFI